MIPDFRLSGEVPMYEALTFGGWLKQRRKALDLTQDDLAAHVGCATETIRKIEAGRRRPSRQMVELLAEQLGVPRDEWDLLVQFARLGEVSGTGDSPLHPAAQPDTSPYRDAARYAHARPAPAHPPSNLPVALTSFVGREKELAAVRALLWRVDVRLLTLTGAGGSGKTRLATQVASELLDDFEDGLCYVSLSLVTRPTMVPSAIAQALGIVDSAAHDLTSALKTYLHSKRMLLVLDNFEHVLEAGVFIAQLLDDARSVKVLATSREPLHLYGEQEFPVPPLALPAPDEEASVENLSHYESIALFVQRAQAVKPSFTLTNENCRAVMEICRRLDGLPLAIELVVPRIHMLPPQAILSRMASSLNLLTGGPRDLPARQQTLRATVDWSYQLLCAAEKRLFRRLSVFVGGCTLEAAQAICCVEGEAVADPLDLIESLLDKSLMLESEGLDGEPRFSMLTTIREYARERLIESGEEYAALANHARFYTEVAERTEMARSSPGYGHMLDRLETEHDNLLAALRWCYGDGNIELGLRLGAALTRFWNLRGYISEASEQLAYLLLKARPMPPSVDRVKVYAGAGEAALEQDRIGVARAYFEAALEDARFLGDKLLASLSLLNLGCSIYFMGEYEQGRECLLDALSTLRALGDIGRAAVALVHLGEIARCQGNVEKARAYYKDAIECFRARGSSVGLAFGLYKFGNMEFLAGNLELAAQLFRESLEVSHSLKYLLGMAGSLAGLAAVAVSRGKASEIQLAALLFGASELIVERAHLHMSTFDRMEYGAIIAAARQRIDQELWSSAWAEGRTMPIDRAIAHAQIVS